MLAIAAFMGLAISLSFAALPASAKKISHPAALKCPVCKMALVTKKDKMHTRAVKIHGKIYYCCAQCNMSKMKPTHKAAVMHKK